MKFLNKSHLVAAATIAVLSSSSAMAGNLLVSQLDEHPNETVQVSGIVTWVEDKNEFTLEDRTGNIEVNLVRDYEELDEGDFVTVSGVLDPTLIDEIESASIVVHADNYASWSQHYYDNYKVNYSLGGLDNDFYAGKDFDAARYDFYPSVD